MMTNTAQGFLVLMCLCSVCLSLKDRPLPNYSKHKKVGPKGFIILKIKELVHWGSQGGGFMVVTTIWIITITGSLKQKALIFKAYLYHDEKYVQPKIKGINLSH